MSALEAVRRLGHLPSGRYEAKIAEVRELPSGGVLVELLLADLTSNVVSLPNNVPVGTVELTAGRSWRRLPMLLPTAPRQEKPTPGDSGYVDLTEKLVSFTALKTLGLHLHAPYTLVGAPTEPS